MAAAFIFGHLCHCGRATHLITIHVRTEGAPYSGRVEYHRRCMSSVRPKTLLGHVLDASANQDILMTLDPAHHAWPPSTRLRRVIWIAKSARRSQSPSKAARCAHAHQIRTGPCKMEQAPVILVPHTPSHQQAALPSPIAYARPTTMARCKMEQLPAILVPHTPSHQQAALPSPIAYARPTTMARLPARRAQTTQSRLLEACLSWRVSARTTT